MASVTRMTGNGAYTAQRPLIPIFSRDIIDVVTTEFLAHISQQDLKLSFIESAHPFPLDHFPSALSKELPILKGVDKKGNSFLTFLVSNPNYEQFAKEASESGKPCKAQHFSYITIISQSGRNDRMIIKEDLPTKDQRVVGLSPEEILGFREYGFLEEIFKRQHPDLVLGWGKTYPVHAVYQRLTTDLKERQLSRDEITRRREKYESQVETQQNQNFSALLAAIHGEEKKQD